MAASADCAALSAIAAPGVVPTDEEAVMRGSLWGLLRGCANLHSVVARRERRERRAPERRVGNGYRSGSDGADGPEPVRLVRCLPLRKLRVQTPDAHGNCAARR